MDDLFPINDPLDEASDSGISPSDAVEETVNADFDEDNQTETEEAVVSEETADSQQINEETYHSKYDQYRFRSESKDTQESESPKTSYEQPKKNYDTNLYGKRNDNSYGYGNSDRHINFKDTGRQNHSNQPKNQKNGGFSLSSGIILAAVFGLVFGLVFFLLTQLVPVSSRQEAQSENTISSEENGLTLGRQDDDSTAITEVDPDEIAEKADEEEQASYLTIPQVTKKVMPSMVAITNTTVQQYRDFFGETYDQESVSAGSGIIVGETEEYLLIATNNHVISGSSDITVTFVDDAAIAGTVRGADADNDLAIVAVAISDIPDATMEAITIVEIGDSDSIEVGDQVVAIGNALGYGQSVSAGIVSATGREISDSDGTTRTVIQTDASINPGNSGGALLNMKGQLIGINEAKLVDTTVEGVGYAIPMAIAEPILTNLGNKASRDKVSEEDAGYLGISCVTMPDSYVESGYPEGVYVASVTSGSPAAQAGLQEGDIITSFDGSSVTTKEELISMLSYYAAGEEVSMSVSRMNSQKNGFEKIQITVTLGTKTEAGIESSSNNNSGSTQDNGNSGSFDSRNGYFGNNGGLFGLFE